MNTSNMHVVVKALSICPRGSTAGDLSVIASVQSLSNSLRHARRNGWVTSIKTNPKVNRSIWYITPAGRAAIKKDFR